MIKKIAFMVLGLILLFCPAVRTFAAAPFPGGEITGAFWELRDGYYHKGVDIGTESGTPIAAPFSGMVEHGAGGNFIYWVTISGGNGQGDLLFGDCNGDTLLCQSGYVTEGTIIGYTGGDAYDGPLGYSSGAHCHVEYWPEGYFQGNVSDPVPILMALGVDLTGAIVGPGGQSGKHGSDNISLPWGIQSMYQLGDTINSSIKNIVEAIGKGYKAIQTAALALLFILAVIDLALPILVAGMEFSLVQVTSKAIKYGFLFFVFMNWNTLVNDFFLNFITSIAGTFVSDSYMIADNIAQPQFLLQKCVFLMTPALNKVATYGGMDFVRNLASILPILLFTWGTIFVYFLLACYIMVIYVGFYLSAILYLFTGPFAVLGFTKFLAEGTLGHFVSSTLKLLVMAIMVGFCVFCIKDATVPQDIFKTETPAVTQTGSGGGIDGPPEYIAMATAAAEKYDVPVNLFLAQIQLESHWDPNAVSRAGAEGIAQFMPDTAAGWGIDPFNPEEALDAAAHYMHNLYEKFGDWNYALAGYNGGPNSLSRDEPLPQWALDYINKVNGNVSGTYIVSKAITAEQMVKHILFSISLLAMAFLTAWLPKSIMKSIGGRYEL